MTFMLDEIHEQPDKVRLTLDAERARLEHVADEIRRRNPSVVVIAARGTSDNAATYAKYLWGLNNKLPVMLAAPSLTTLYHATPSFKGALVLGISQSGESTDIVEVVRTAREQGAFTLAVTASAESALGQVADECVLLHSGVERAVAATKTYTTTLAVLAQLSAHLSGNTALMRALDAIPDALSAVLSQVEPSLTKAERYRYMSACAIIGRGLNYCTALETAQKVKETSYVVADPFSTADFRHGPIAIVGSDFPILLFAPPGQTYPDMLKLAQDMRARNADIVVFSSEREILDLATVAIEMPQPVADGVAGEAVSPLVYIVAGQLFAHALCATKGLDPDQPRGLTKVTFTL